MEGGEGSGSRVYGRAVNRRLRVEFLGACAGWSCLPSDRVGGSEKERDVRARATAWRRVAWHRAAWHIGRFKAPPAGAGSGLGGGNVPTAPRRVGLYRDVPVAAKAKDPGAVGARSERVGENGNSGRDLSYRVHAYTSAGMMAIGRMKINRGVGSGSSSGLTAEGSGEQCGAADRRRSGCPRSGRLRGPPGGLARQRKDRRGGERRVAQRRPSPSKSDSLCVPCDILCVLRGSRLLFQC